MATKGSRGGSKKPTGASGAASNGKPAAKKAPAKKAPAKKRTTRKKAPAKQPIKKAEESVAEDVAAAEEAVAVQEVEEVAPAAEEKTEEMTSPEEQMSESVEAKNEPDVPGETEPAVAVEQEVDLGTSSMVANKMIAFHLGGQRYAVPLAVVQEIQQIVAFSEIPAAGGAVVGMVNLRGSVIPAIDMRYLIGLAPEEYTLETPMIICRAHDQLVALVVDEVEDVLAIPEGCLHPPPAMHNLSSKMIGVCRLDTELVYLLDVETLVAPMELPRG